MTELKSIWHKPSETPRNYSAIIEHHKANDYDNHTLIEQYDIWVTGGSPVNPFDEYTIRWAYVEDFLALEQELADTKKKLDIANERVDVYMGLAAYAKEHIDGLNSMLESWYKLLQSDKDTATKYAILKSAISAYVENKGGDNE